MKKLLYPLICLAVLLANIARCDDVPFFSSLREEIASQLAVASNNVPQDKKLLASLRSNLKIVEKTKPTLIAGSGALGTLAKGLVRTSLSNTFLPILTDTRTVYIDVMKAEVNALDYRLGSTIPGTAQTAARTALAKVSPPIEDASTNVNLTLSLKSLSKAAKALATAEKAVAKAETAKPGPNFLTATITESNQGVTILKSTKTFLDAYYDPFSGEIDIDAADLKKLAGGRAQLRALVLAAIVPGEGTYSLSLTNESNAYYGRVVAPSLNEFNEYYPKFDFEELYLTVDPFNERLGTGTMNITVDLNSDPEAESPGIIWGNFTFTASGRDDSSLQVSITGSFLIRLSTFSDGDYE